MTTPPPDTQAQSGTLEQIADRIARRHYELGSNISLTVSERELVNTILAALRERDERAARICEQGAMLASPAGVIPADDPEHERLQRLTDVLNSAARAIREGR